MRRITLLSTHIGDKDSRPFQWLVGLMDVSVFLSENILASFFAKTPLKSEEEVMKMFSRQRMKPRGENKIVY